MWLPSEILALAAGALRDAEARLDQEQAVRGLDALAEVELHPILAEGLVAQGFGVIREQPFPGEPASRPEHRERERCDLVLLPSPDAVLADPVATLREQDRLAGTLFEQHAAQRPPDPAAVAPEDAYWLEIKCVGQHTIVDGYAGPNRTYASELIRAIATDVRKLARDPHIDTGALLLALFTADEAIARHDLDAALHRCLDRHVPLGHPEIDAFPITDRIGNTTCLVALIPARKAPVDD